MQKDYKQQENNETTSISDHLRKINVDKEKCSILIAPRIHNRVVDYFNYCICRNKLSILATTKELYIQMIEENQDVEQFKSVVINMTEKMAENNIEEYCDYINNYRIKNI